jgi:ELMO domain-containing protein
MGYMEFCNFFFPFFFFNCVESSLVKQESFQKLLHKQEGTRAEWEYPFAVAGVNISFMLIQMLDLQSSIFS